MKRFISAPLMSLIIMIGVVTLPTITHGGGIVQQSMQTSEVITTVGTSTSVNIPEVVSVPLTPVKAVWNIFEMPELGITLKLPWTKDEVLTGCTQKGFDVTDYTACDAKNSVAYYVMFKADDDSWTPRLQAVVMPASLNLNIDPLKTVKNKNFETVLFKPDQNLIDQLDSQYTIKKELVDMPQYAIAVKQSSRTIILLFSMDDITQSREFLLSSVAVK